MARKPLMVGNWKMNNTIAEAVVLAQDISNQYEKDWDEWCDIVVCPPYVDLKPVKTVFDFDRVPVAVGAQNVHWENSGAYTGEVSVSMLAEIGCKYCIVGHSERREMFGETNENVNKKVKALLAAEITPIACVGESLAIRDEGSYLDYIEAQVRAALAGLDEDEAMRCIVGYEPVWAIGTGRTATPEQAEEVCSHIRETLREMFGEQASEDMRVLYGGSMNPGNVAMLIAEPDIDGGLIGGAALKAESFVQMIEACK
ncbi:MAG: triose-phosphate isomerase [Eggerthellaceae bacterium]|nr:triose-phosphate isomerase [Eggerthellaceae bacterium]